MKTFKFLLTLVFLIGNSAFAQNPVNQIVNPGFEQAGFRWIRSGGVFSIEKTDFAEGLAAGKYDAAVNNDFLRSNLVAVPKSLHNRDCVVSMKYNGGDANLKLQIYDGTNALREVVLTPVTVYTDAEVTFTCPNTGNLSLRILATADAAEIKVDSTFLGLNELTKVAQSAIATNANYPATASCSWTRTSTSSGAFPTTAACPAIVVANSDAEAIVDTADDDLPTMKWSSLSPGSYDVQVMFTVALSVAVADSTYTLRDNTASADLDKRSYGNQDASNFDVIALHGTFDHLVEGPKSLEIFGEVSSGNLTIQNATATGTAGQMQWIVKRFPLGSQKVIQPKDQGWHINANIGGPGAIISLGTSDVTTYTGMGTTNLDLVTNPGSAPVLIGCAGTTESTSSTCTAADEQNAISFTPPFAGTFRACVSFAHEFEVGNATNFGGVFTTFQIVETPNNAQTILAEGNERIPSGHRTTEPGAGNRITGKISHRRCGLFTFNLVAKKTLRLMFEQDAISLLLNSRVIVNRTATLGQQDVHWEVFPVTRHVPQTIVLNQLSSPSSGGIKVATAFITNSGTPTVSREDGDWIVGNPSDDAVGSMTFTLVTGTFSTSPNCFITLDANGFCSRATTSSATSVGVDTIVCSSGAQADAPFQFMCIGPR